MSSKKGYSLEQVDDLNGGVAVENSDSGITVPYPTPAEEYSMKDENTCVSLNIPPKTKVSNEEFVKNWMSCDSYDDMSFNTGMTVSAVQARATRLRKAGVQLPSFTRATRKTKEIDVAGLNNMIDSNTMRETTNE